MIKNNKLIFYSIGIAFFAVLSFFGCAFSSSRFQANSIFNRSANAVVEIKATNSQNDLTFESYGTGVLIDRNGNIVTNYHVISYVSLNKRNIFEKIEIRFIDEEEYHTVSVEKIDEELDLAELHMQTNEECKYIKMAKKEYSFGDKVYAIGNTSNFGIGISEGIISVPEVNIAYDGIVRTMIQCDINIANGNSGGALLNNRGQLIGITTFRTKDNCNNINYGFVYAIPVSIVKSFLDY